MGTQLALFAIGVGSLFGAGLLGWVAQLGAARGLSSSGLMQQTFGSRFAKLPIILNVLQLLGWTAFELVIMRDGTAAMIFKLIGLKAIWVPILATMFFGILLYVLASGSMVSLVRRFVGRYALPLIILSLLWLTAQFLMKAQMMPGGFLISFQTAWRLINRGKSPLIPLFQRGRENRFYLNFMRCCFSRSVDYIQVFFVAQVADLSYSFTAWIINSNLCTNITLIVNRLD